MRGGREPSTREPSFIVDGGRGRRRGGGGGGTSPPRERARRLQVGEGNGGEGRPMDRTPDPYRFFLLYHHGLFGDS